MSQILKFKGPIFYTRVWPGQIDRAFEEVKPDGFSKGGCFSVEMPLSDEDALTLKTAGSKMKPGRENGRYKFRRYERATFGELGPVVVKGVPEGESIGNESIAEITVEVYETKFNGRPTVGVRLQEVNILEFKPYVKVDPTAATDGPPVH